MAIPAPPPVEVAVQQLKEQIRGIAQQDVPVETAPWSELEKHVVKLLGGAFSPERPEHQALALGLAGVFAQRLAAESGGFWFSNRESLEGASLGFADAMMVLSPFGAVMDALMQARLSKLDDLAGDVRKSLAQVKFGGAGAMRLTPRDYERLFDPGFLQFVSVDPKKLKDAWETPVSKLSRDLKDAIGRASKLPPEARQQLEAQLVGTLDRLDGQKTLMDQIDRAGRMAELVGHLMATADTTGSAPEEFWHDFIFPLLYIGSPASFPEPDAEELDAFTKGVDPLFLFIDVVPHQTQSLEGALLDTFPPEELELPHPALGRVPNVHLVKLPLPRLEALVSSFDAAKSREAIERFSKTRETKAGKAPPSGAEAKAMLEGSLHLLSELKALSAQATKNGLLLFLRRVTEAEGQSEATLNEVRLALSAPRIILA